MSDGPKSVLWNIIGGVIVALLTLLVGQLIRCLRHWKFKRIFGNDVDCGLKLKYGPLIPSPLHPDFTRPDTKVKRPKQIVTNQTLVAPDSNILATSHLASTIGRNAKMPPNIESDAKEDDIMDTSFVAIGFANYRTYDLIEDEGNIFLNQTGTNIISKKSKLPFIINPKPDYDYGVIIKINPTCSQSQTWICCAGLGNWGTSGAAWYLAKHWKSIWRWAGKKPFAIITETRNNSDDSTTFLHKFLNCDEVELAAQALSQNHNRQFTP